MNRLYANFQVLFLGLIGLIMVGGSHFGVENYEILDSTTPDAILTTSIDLPSATHHAEITTNFATTPVAQVKAVASSTPVQQSSTPVSKNTISIGGRTINIKTVSDTTVNAGNLVAKYGSKFLYGHNTSQVFGHLAGLGVGTTFTVTLNGQTTTYQIAKAVTLEKTAEVVPIMYKIAQAQYRGTSYDLALMTCAGTSYGNGDASHRLVVFANRV